MPARDKTGPGGKGPGTGRGMGPCVTEKQLPRDNNEPKETTEKQLDKERGTGLGPCGDGKPRGGGGGGGGGGCRRKGPNGITYYT